MNAFKQLGLKTLLIFVVTTMLLSACAGQDPVTTADMHETQTALAGPALTDADGWHLVGYSTNPAGKDYQSTAPDGSCWPTALISLKYGEKADWDFGSCKWKKSSMNITSASATPIPTQTKNSETTSGGKTPMAPNSPVVKSAEKTVRDTIVAGCQTGSSVTVGSVTINCSGEVLPEPADYNKAPAGHQNGTVTTSDQCMTDGEMRAAHGFASNEVKAVFTGMDVIWDSCKWDTQAVGIGLYYQPYLANWEYTVTNSKGIVTVNKGPGGEWIYGATIRQLDAMDNPEEYWLDDDVVLMAREYNFGYGRNPRYGTVPGVNLNLRGLWHQPSITQTCPAEGDTVQAAALLGGDDPKFWTAPDWERGAWKFLSKGEGYHHLTWTGTPGFFDIWTAKWGAITVSTAEQARLYFGDLRFEEASYHCLPE